MNTHGYDFHFLPLRCTAPRIEDQARKGLGLKANCMTVFLMPWTFTRGRPSSTPTFCGSPSTETSHQCGGGRRNSSAAATRAEPYAASPALCGRHPGGRSCSPCRRFVTVARVRRRTAHRAATNCFPDSQWPCPVATPGSSQSGTAVMRPAHSSPTRYWMRSTRTLGRGTLGASCGSVVRRRWTGLACARQTSFVRREALCKGRSWVSYGWRNGSAQELRTLRLVRTRRGGISHQVRRATLRAPVSQGVHQKLAAFLQRVPCTPMRFDPGRTHRSQQPDRPGRTHHPSRARKTCALVEELDVRKEQVIQNV